MSFLLSGMVIKAPLQQSEKLVMLAIAEAANNDGYSWPSVRHIMETSMCSERTVSRVLRRLSDPERDGGPLLIIEHRTDRTGRCTSNGYTIISQNIPQKPQHKNSRKRLPPQNAGDAQLPPQNAGDRDSLYAANAGTSPASCGSDPRTMSDLESVIESISESIKKNPPPPKAEIAAGVYPEKTNPVVVEESENLEPLPRMTTREAVRLAETLTGRVVNGLQVEVLQRFCRDYPSERIRGAFEAATGAGVANLNWCRKWLENPANGRASPNGGIVPIEEQEWFKRMYPNGVEGGQAA